MAVQIDTRIEPVITVLPLAESPEFALASKLSMDNGYLLFSGVKVKSGYSDFAQEAGHSLEADHTAVSDFALTANHADYANDSVLWASKAFADYLNQPLRTTDNVTFNNISAQKLNADQSVFAPVIGSPNYVSGLTGEGWQVDAFGNVEFNSVSIRTSLTVPQLVIKEVTGNGGAVAITNTAKIKTVTETPTGYDCTIDTAGGTVGLQLRENDLVRCQVWDGAGEKYYWMKAVNVNLGAGTFTILKSGTADDGIPAVNDNIFQFGNNTDTTRQGLLYLTNSDPGGPYMDVLDGINSMSLAGKTKVRLGKLSGITSVTWGVLNGYGLYSQNAYLENGYFSGEVNVTSGNAAKIDYVDALRSDTFTQFGVVDGLIAAKVSQIDFNALGGRVSAAESNITANATQIDLRVKTADYNTGLANTLNSANSYTDSGISILQGEIDLKASKTDLFNVGANVFPNGDFADTDYYIPSDINNIGLGNIRINNNPANQGTYKGYNSVFFDTNAGDTYFYFRNQPFKLKPNTTYTVSLLSRTAGAYTQRGCYLFDVNNNFHIGIDINDYPDGNWERTLTTFTTLSGADTFHIRFGIVCSGYSWAQFACVKIEEGSVATPFTTDNVSISSRISTVEINIDANTTAIGLKASQSDVTALTNRVSTAEANITPTAINLTVSQQVTDKSLAASWVGGKSLYNDPTFLNWMNGLGLYNNAGTGAMEFSRVNINATLGTDYYGPTKSPYGVHYYQEADRVTSPGLGGFSFNTPTRPGAKFLFRLIIGNDRPGVTINYASNSYGDGGSNRWLTTQVLSTNWREWREHIVYVECGSTGTFDDGGYFYFDGASTVSAIVAFAGVYDITDSNDLVTATEVKSSFSVDVNGINILGKHIDMTGVVTFTSMDAALQNNINMTNGWAYPGKATINGGAIEAYSVKAISLDVQDLFAQSATISGNMTITGTLTATTGSFNGVVNATTGTIGGFKITGGNLTVDPLSGTTVSYGVSNLYNDGRIHLESSKYYSKTVSGNFFETRGAEYVDFTTDAGLYIKNNKPVAKTLLTLDATNAKYSTSYNPALPDDPATTSDIALRIKNGYVYIDNLPDLYPVNGFRKGRLKCYENMDGFLALVIDGSNF